MTDDEIATKPISDWMPETNPKLQKAFGKFVEEASELIEAGMGLLLEGNTEFIVSIEDEIADSLATIHMIEQASEGQILSDRLKFAQVIPASEERTTFSSALLPLIKEVAVSLNMVGRCQIQGLSGNHPETNYPNAMKLSENLFNLKLMLNHTVHILGLYAERIEKRKTAKINSKLPWVMGQLTQTDSDVTVFNSQSYPVGSVVRVCNKKLEGMAPIKLKVIQWTKKIEGESRRNDVLVKIEGTFINSWVDSDDYLVVVSQI